MTEQGDGGFRGRIPGTGSPGGSPDGGAPGGPWGWGRIADERPRVPLFGVILVLFGGLLLIEQLLPEARILGSGLVVAVGLGLLAAWFVGRRVWQLYAGAILTAVSLPGLFSDLGVIREGQGWGTLFLGGAFVAIALVRAGTRGGIGWQMAIGVVLTVIGGAQVAEREIPTFPALGRLLWPALILLVGLVLVIRSTSRRSGPPPAP